MRLSVARIRFSAMALLLAAIPVLLAACGTMQGQELRPVTPLPTALAGALPTSTSTPVLLEEERVAEPTRAVTPTPLSINLPAGSAAAIAAATDAAFVPTPRNTVTFDMSPVRLRFDEFYDGYNMRSGLILSDKLVALDGQEVVMEGYMAPPLKPSLDFFVLTRVRLAFCPFCSTAADWPDDIALIYLVGGEAETTTDPLRVRGRLELGPLVDAETGMVSLVRIYAESWEVIS